MGECIITRSGGGGEAEAIVPITPGYHTILASLKADDGRAISNHIISCKDGDRYYNYTTNEKGQAMFVCNSGSANFLISNVINGIVYVDVSNTWINVDAPIGLSSKINLIHNINPSYTMLSTGSFYTLCDRNVNLHIVGGGGGGGGAFTNWTSTQYGGGGGGAGYMNNYNTLLNKGKYDFVVGSGGSGGRSEETSEKHSYNTQNTTPGSTGGTSYIKNTSFSAAGGSGGIPQRSSDNSASGGLGYGGTYTSAGGPSPVSYAGGGGGGGNGARIDSWSTSKLPGGSPYGGAGGNHYFQGQSFFYVAPLSGSRGGGGGGDKAISGTGMTLTGGGRGGDGLLYIEFLK